MELIEAAGKGYLDKVKELINAKCNVDLQNNFGHTALIFATMYEHTEILKLYREKSLLFSLQCK